MPFYDREGERNEKYLAEFIGTLALVTMGCGTAMLVGCDAASGCGYLLTALAFGLSIVAMAYCIGNISGCHVNPAVSLGVFLSGGMSIVDFIGYVIAQCLGAFAGAGILAAIFHLGDVTDKTGGYGSNGLAGVNDSIFAGLLVEIILTFLFVLTILGLLRRKPIMVPSAVWSSVYPLTLVHILGIGLTGTSVNPARSLGPAIVAAISGNTTPIGCVWVFLVAPLIGAALAALIYRGLAGREE